MDELKEFYNNPMGTKAIKLRGPQTCGVRLTDEDTAVNFNRREEHQKTVLLTGTDYAREIKERETEMYLSNMVKNAATTSYPGGIESLEHLSSLGLSEPNIMRLDAISEFDSQEDITQVYKKYSFQMKEDTNNLAINDYKQKIIDSINTQEVIIIEGPTGCGKTTQVPQWILDDCYQKRKHCKIVVTQPRRIAAISIAKRVGQERGWDVGGLVGYQVGLDNKTSTDTKILYATTGVLLQKLVSNKTLNEFTHIVLDEVHERGQEMDFLLLIVKKLLNTVSRGVKVILMSATFNCAAFASYFQTPTSRGFELSPWIQIPKKSSMFTVKTFYLNHLHKLAILDRCMSKNDTPTIEPDMYRLVINLINAFEPIDQKEDDYADPAEADIPSVLVFLPGIHEIEELYGYLTNNEERVKSAGVACGKHKWWVLPLHSTITAEEQVRVFQRAPRGHRKIILSTNIAESSITVPDIKYVIDFCLMKVLVADEQTNFTSLQLKWASKTNCEQRAGRAGRVRDGRVYRLVTDRFYEGFSDECAPEIQRCPLERLVLLAKMLNMGPPIDILALAMDPPDLSNIHRTTLVLKEIGALKTTLNGSLSAADGDLTFLGRVLARLPLDARVAKLIVLGHIFGCLEEAIIMAAAMSVKNIFSSPFRERLNAYNAKLTWADGSGSDCIAFYNAYKAWDHLRKQNFFKQAGNNEAAWARTFFVQARALHELHAMVRELSARLAREGIAAAATRAPYARSELPLINVILLAGAFYPNYFVQVSSDENREREAVKMLGGHDPRTTVYLKDFPMEQPGPLYATSIKRIIQRYTGDEPRITFDGNSLKVYLTFDSNAEGGARDSQNRGNPTIPGKVVLPVYKAVKARHLKMDIQVALLPPEKAELLSRALEASKSTIDKNLMVPRLPEIDDTHIPVKISQFVDCSNFYAQYDDESTASDLRQIQRALNEGALLAHTGVVAAGDLYAAPYTDASGTQYCRVRVHKVLPRDMVWVVYIDWGSFGRVSVSNLRVLPGGGTGAAAGSAAARACRALPPLAMPCALAELAPAPLLDARAAWSERAHQLFHHLTERAPLIAKVYSVAHGVVHVELLADNGLISINRALLDKGFALPCEESYESKMNHDLRETATELGLAQKRAHNKQQTELAFRELWECEPPRDKDCVLNALLKGPFSPLEARVHSVMFASREKAVTVEGSSVNSVLLDTEPQDCYQRLLVAAAVGTNEMATKLTLRHTTLMPNIPGLPAIIALLFCPRSELRRDASCSRFVSALCGLGAGAQGGRPAPLFPEHDLLVDVDVDLSIEDIGIINHIRHLMDSMLYCNPGQDAPTPDANTATVPLQIRDRLLKLLSRRRRATEVGAGAGAGLAGDAGAGWAEGAARAWEWGAAPQDELLEISAESMLERAVVFPLHEPPELRPRDQQLLQDLRRDTDQLVALVARTSSASSGSKEVQCRLCDTERMTVQAMRIHLYSRAHRERDDELRTLE